MFTKGSLTLSHISTMDRECVSLLPGVCEVLADSGRSLPDDTSLEKLLDWFTGLTKSGGCLLESCPCLLELITSVVNNTALDPSILSFTLRLTGLIAATEDGFRELQEHSALDGAFSLQHWQDSGLWEDPCLRIGWIQGLKNSLQHQQALSFFVEADLTEHLLKLQTDTSLFVASAANQMLAHILLFFQPVSSAGCNSADKTEDKLNGSRDASNTDLKCPYVTVGPRAEYEAFAKVIMEYLKKSLVLKEDTQLHQNLQTLKLLALLLAQARPPLREELLQTLSGSLEELVNAGCSQLTSPLMEVILAAYSSSNTAGRVPDRRVSRLLSSMLNINKPSDLIRAAAAFLLSGHHDADPAARAVRILLLPLSIITGHSLLGTNITGDDQGSSMIEHLKKKTSCISAVCVCLTNTPNMTPLPAGVLPCPPSLITAAVLTLLHICSGISSSSMSSGCREVCRNVIGSARVQKCALEALTCLSSSPGAKENISDAFTVLINYLENPECEPTVLHKSYQALLNWISVCSDVSFTSERLRQDLTAVVKKRVCDMRWEVRDSTVEFLGHLAGIHVFMESAKEVNSASEALLGDCCTTSLLREALQDSESYVRASAVSALAKTQTHRWQQGAALTQEETETVNQLLETLSQDTEGFPRRAVVQYFITWFSSSSSSTSSFLMQCVRSVLSQGSADLDWEVKVHTLELAELLLDEAFSGQTGYRKDSDTHPTPQHPYGAVSERTYTLHTQTEQVKADVGGALKDLVDQGVVSVLLSGLVDCDRPVGLKACKLLITLRDTVCPAAGVKCELPGRGWGKEIRKILGTESGTFNRDTGAETGEKDAEEEDERVSVPVCDVLKSLGLEERLDVLTKSSDHVHNSPLSLLQDILTVRATHARSDAEEGQEVIVDCY